MYTRSFFSKNGWVMSGDDDGKPVDCVCRRRGEHMDWGYSPPSPIENDPKQHAAALALVEKELSVIPGLGDLRVRVRHVLYYGYGATFGARYMVNDGEPVYARRHYGRQNTFVSKGPTYEKLCLMDSTEDLEEDLDYVRADGASYYPFRRVLYAGEAIAVAFTINGTAHFDSPIYAATPAQIRRGVEEHTPHLLEELADLPALTFIMSEFCESIDSSSTLFKDGDLQSFWTRPLPLAAWILGPLNQRSLRYNNQSIFAGGSVWDGTSRRTRIDKLYARREAAPLPAAA